MKKLVISIVALCYFAVSCGVVVNFHYCMDRLASTSFFAPEIKKCGRCGMDIHQSNGCCRDEMQLLKLEDDQNKTTIDDYTLRIYCHSFLQFQRAAAFSQSFPAIIIRAGYLPAG